MEFEELFTIWSKKEETFIRRNKRRYIHFDTRINFQKKLPFFKKLFSDETLLSKHSFYPFILIEIITKKYKLDKSANKRSLLKKKRPILYSSHFDSYVYSWFSTLLNEKYKKYLIKHDLTSNVTAYLESGKSNIDFAFEAFEFIKNNTGYSVLALDIQSFFDTLDHNQLKNYWLDVLNFDTQKNLKTLPISHYKVYKSLTNYVYVEKEALDKIFPTLKKRNSSLKRICEPNEYRDLVRKNNLLKKNPNKNPISSDSNYGKMCGIPQGSPISACLSNIYMLQFDLAMKIAVEELGGLYRRYSDDILIAIHPMYMDNIKKLALSEITKNHLVINQSKLELLDFTVLNGELKAIDRITSKISYLQYLGFEFDGSRIFIRSSSLSKYHRRLNIRIRENLKAAYGKNSIGNSVFRKKLYNRFTSKGKRNFISYALRAAETMSSVSISNQVKNNNSLVGKKISEIKNKFEEKRRIDIKLK